MAGAVIGIIGVLEKVKRAETDTDQNRYDRNCIGIGTGKGHANRFG